MIAESLLKPKSLSVKNPLSSSLLTLPNLMRPYALNYNFSQIEIFNQVSSLKPKDVQLIQGPPGTGKTETITGILALLLHKKADSIIQVCAPSNCAVDEILTRIRDKGLVGIAKTEKGLKK